MGEMILQRVRNAKGTWDALGRIAWLSDFSMVLLKSVQLW
jgi:hypothetical protein